MIPIQILAEERKISYNQKSTPSELRKEQRKQRACYAGKQRDVSTKGRWTHRLIPQVDNWVNRKHGELNYYLTQMLSGHGCFRAYLHRFGYEESPDCPADCGVAEDAEYVFFQYSRFDVDQDKLKDALGEAPTPDKLVQSMLAADETWAATCRFATIVLKALRAKEQKREKATTESPPFE